MGPLISQRNNAACRRADTASSSFNGAADFSAEQLGLTRARGASSCFNGAADFSAEQPTRRVGDATETRLQWGR